ncbi:MAG TPA: YraN family protein [Gammaproteobacteria bacterium]|nr:YraN family protein [Gammaproteobacteria bacterium]
MPSPSQLKGSSAESEAEKFLLSQGLKKISRNYHCPYGEIDLVMCAGRELIFVEVRHRTHSDFGDPAATVSKHKQQKIIKTALHFLQNRPEYSEFGCRFDVVGIGSDADSVQKLNWIRDAFQTEVSNS